MLDLVKVHGAGNDFLVVLDAGGAWPLTGIDVVALCDRRTGVGADGLLRATRLVAVGANDAEARGGAEGLPGIGHAYLAMEVVNADGSAAEISGNGLRCLAHAARWKGLAVEDEFTVRTGAGPRRVAVHLDRGNPWQARAEAEMGTPRLVEDVTTALSGAVPGLQAAWLVDVGNPHLVCLCGSLGSVDIATDGPRLATRFANDVNVELVAPAADPGAIDLLVWERGAGVTSACGSGSVAAAVLHRRVRGGTGTVRVRNPGGELVVRLDGGRAVLEGPSTIVAEVRVRA